MLLVINASIITIVNDTTLIFFDIDQKIFVEHYSYIKMLLFNQDINTRCFMRKGN